MPRISQHKRDKIAEQILHYLFAAAPEARFTVQIAREIVRDEEFTLALLKDLEQKKLVVSIAKNPAGAPYQRRKRWRLSNEAYAAYKRHQPPASQFSPLPSIREKREEQQEPKTPPIAHYIG